MAHLNYFRGSILFTLIGILLAYMIGGLESVFIVSVLAILEISLSFDNAVVNARVLKHMDLIWRRRFLTWGILIAVFGMRIVFPVLIVSLVSGVSPVAALDIAINDPAQYQAHMEASHISIMAFGGAFLLMVALDFFFDDEKDHWIPFIEKPFVHLGRARFSAEVISVFAIMSVALLGLSDADEMDFLYAGIGGILTFTLIHQLSAVMERREQESIAAALDESADDSPGNPVGNGVDKSSHSGNAAVTVAKSGFVMFMYLEVLDASFSFDGVIGAFAITTDLFIIAIGLGIGAMFVRSLTILLVEKETLAEYRFLEHGAFYAIIALAVIMFLKTFMHIPEVITGLIGAGFIITAMLHSLKYKE